MQNRFIFPMNSENERTTLHEPYSQLVGNERIDREWFMASTHVQILEVFPFHEPWMRRADIPVCRFGRLSSRQKQKHGTGMSREPAGWKACATSRSRFMVPMHAQKAEGGS